MSNLDALNDLELVAIARQQLPYTTTAYEALMSRYQQALVKFCVRFLGSYEDGEDACQNTMLKAYHSLHGFKENAKFSTWLYQLAKNECIDRYRKSKKEKQLIDGYSDIDDAEMTYSLSNEDRQQKPTIEKFLADLTLEEKQIFLLRYASGFEFQEISDITGLGISAAKMRCKRIVEKLHAIHQLSPNN